MTDQDHNLYGQLYSQLLGKLNLAVPDTITASPSVPQPDTVVSDPTVAPEGAIAVARDEVQISSLTKRHDFQLLYPFQEWWWPEPAEGYIDSNAYLFLSRMPLSLWNPTKPVTMYESSDKDLYSTYRNVLLSAPNIEVGSSGSDWVSEYSQALSVSEKPSSPSEDKPGFVKMTTNAGTIAIENYLVAHGKDWISELKKEAEGKDPNSISSGEEVTLLKLSFDLSAALPSTSENVPTPKEAFFRVYTSNNKWENFDVALHDNKASVSVKVGAIKHVPVYPDHHWYDHQYLHALAKRDSWNPPFTTTDVFGEKGLLSQRMSKLIAAYHIAFTVKVSPETYKKFEPNFKAARGFRIGPFHFGAGADIASKHSPNWKHESKADTSTFEGESMADYPTIIGVRVERIVRHLDNK